MAISPVQAIDFTITSPNNIDLNQEFTITLSSSETEIHDVKIFVYKDTVSNIISEIKSGSEWKNPYYYLKEAFPTNKEFTIKVIEEPGERELCARLRLTGKSSYDQQCQAITISSQSIPLDDNNHQPDPDKDNLEEPGPIKSAPPTTSPQPVTAKLINQPESSNTGQDLQPNNDPIVLNSPIIQADQIPQTYTTSEGKKQIYILYGFTILCVIIIILLALRKL
jgi:hypothetical protein